MLSACSSRRAVLVPLLLALGTFACNGGAKAEESADLAPGAPPPAVQAEAEPALATSVSDAPAAKEAEATRMVIRTARVELRSDTPGDVVVRAIRIAEEAGGFVAGSQAHGVGEQIEQATATLRIPATQLQAVLDTLRSEGELLHESLGGEDVTDQYVDLSARLRSERTLETRLLDILGKVQTVEEALQVETQLDRVRTEIERLDAQRRTMEDRVALATVDLVVSSPVRHNALPTETVTSKVDRALDDAGEAFVAVVTGLIRVLGGLLPLALLFGPIGFAVHRGVRRRKAARALALHAATRHDDNRPYPG